MKHILDNGKMTFPVELENTTTPQVMSTKEVSKKESIMDKELTNSKMVVSMLVNGLITKCMERVCSLIKMLTSGKETLSMAYSDRRIKES